METLMKKSIHLDYNQIAMRLDAKVEEIRSEDFTAIAVIVRGGSFPGNHISVRTGLPIFYLKHAKDNVRWIGDTPPKGKLLVSEDLAGSGRTLLDCLAFLKDEGYEYKTLVVFKDTYSASNPNYCCFETEDPNVQFVLPWEKFKTNPLSLVKRNGYLQDHEYEFTGWDMDGVFLDDVPSKIYEQGLEQALLIRDEYEMASYAPSLQPQDIIITGRPIIDEVRTKRWLTEKDLHNPVIFRDDGILHPTFETTAHWKGTKAVEMGCFRYVESDPMQAMYIAAHFPQLEVVWWNQGNPISLQASVFAQPIKAV